MPFEYQRYDDNISQPHRVHNIQSPQFYILYDINYGDRVRTNTIHAIFVI